jgi:hypothetical protein
MLHKLATILLGGRNSTPASITVRAYYYRREKMVAALCARNNNFAYLETTA